MSDLLKSYPPRWLYLSEFMDSLPGANEDEKKEAVLLLIRDRLIADGRLDETHFRFLSGKPQIEDATWLANLSHDDVAWGDSTIRATSADPFAQSQWFLIEIATSGLSLFRASSRAKGSTPHRKSRSSPAQDMARAEVIARYGKIPSDAEATTQKIFQEINRGRAEGDVISKGTLEWALGRRK